MPDALAETLYEAITRELPNLQQITEERAKEVLRPEGWNRKQELGHLIDSAANNHVRFVRAAIEDEFRGPAYNQNAWVDLHGWAELPWATIVDFWFRYNSVLVQLLRRIPDEKLGTPCYIGSHPVQTLEVLATDYVAHMQHHLDASLKRDQVTPYPAVAAKSP